MSFVLLVAGGGVAAAQQPAPGVEVLPRAVTLEIARLYDEPHALRGFDRTEIEAGRVVPGSVSVVDGPLIVAGRIDGRILAINADVILRPGARVAGDILVVGGEVEGEREADIGGEIRVYRPALRFTRDGERIIVTEPEATAEEESWWRRWERRRADRSRNRLVVASGGTYNRVEGLPVNLGPVLELDVGPWVARAEAFAVVRTGSSFRRDSSNIGHDVELQLTNGDRAGIRIGGRLFNVNAPVESWQLSRLEYGLAAFLFRRDYQDFFARHGGSGHVELFDDRFGDVRLTYSHERWSPRDAHDPFALFRGGGWRANPTLDAARLHILRGSVNFDTRNDHDRPWAGWYVLGDLERGDGELLALGPTSPGTRSAQPGRTSYSRGFIDARLYNRVGPAAQLNFRVVAGGWLGGDDLPLQRRLSVSGAGALPGFDFRTPIGPEDVGTCTRTSTTAPATAAGTPALCDRILLGQAEYRGDLNLDFFGAFDWRELRLRQEATWVVFADAGRGWLVGAPEGAIRYRKDELPPPGTFRTDVGLGLDFGAFGVFVAKAVSEGQEPPNFLFRLRHRF